MNLYHHSFATSVPLWVLHATWLSVHNETEQFSRCMPPFRPRRTETPSPYSRPIPLPTNSLDKETSIDITLLSHCPLWIAFTIPRESCPGNELDCSTQKLAERPIKFQLKASTEALYSTTLWTPVSTSQKVVALEDPPYIKLRFPTKLDGPSPLWHGQSSTEWCHPSPWCAANSALFLQQAVSMISGEPAWYTTEDHFFLSRNASR